jgi:hypothetical protein
MEMGLVILMRFLSANSIVIVILIEMAFLRQYQQLYGLG